MHGAPGPNRRFTSCLSNGACSPQERRRRHLFLQRDEAAFAPSCVFISSRASRRVAMHTPHVSPPQALPCARKALPQDRPAWQPQPSMSLEVLHFSLVLLCALQRRKCTQVPALAGLRISLARVKPILTRLKLANHAAEPSVKEDVCQHQYERRYAQHPSNQIFAHDGSPWIRWKKPMIRPGTCGVEKALCRYRVGRTPKL
jgi:hypothetical protein